MIVAGIGCRRGVGADEVLATIAHALATTGVDRSQLDALATADDKISEDGITEAARRWSLPLIAVPHARLRAAGGGASTHSPRVMALKRVPSIAETAALAAAGEGARLLAPRLASSCVTCALAIGDGA